MIKTIVLALVLCSALSAPANDKMDYVPGYPKDFTTKSAVYSGYLPIQTGVRQLHYVFIQSANGNGNKDPLTIWFNGGPGCSSLLGFLQQIGPYYLEDGVNYKEGDNFTQNKHSWHKLSNLLFIESPAIVGFSFNTEKDFEYNDVQTAQDNFIALQEFYRKFPEFKDRGLWLAGQSYAGKYIPDLAVLIIQSNDLRKTDIRLRGILIGNGIISFNHLHKSTIQFMIDRNFVDPQNLQYWKSSCRTDPDSAGCQFFEKRFQEDTAQINPYNVYGYCYYNDSFDSNKTKQFESQYSILQKIKKQFNEKAKQMGSAQNVNELVFTNNVEVTPEDLVKVIEQIEKGEKSKFNGAPCAYFDGMLNYFNAHAKQYNAAAQTHGNWNGPCVQGKWSYDLNPKGSIESYRFLLSRQTDRSQIILYSGTWDAVVPYIDTIKNIKHQLNLRQSYIYHPWFTGNQHSGFAQLYSGLLFLTVKGASHQVPQAKREVSFQIFNDSLTGHSEFQHLPKDTKAKLLLID